MGIIGNIGGGGGVQSPASVVTGTGFYTVPAGFFAVAKVHCRDDQYFQVNGANVINQAIRSWSTIASSGNMKQDGGFSGRLATYSNAVPATGPDVYTNSTGYDTNTSTQSFNLPTGSTINAPNGALWLVELYPL